MTANHHGEIGVLLKKAREEMHLPLEQAGRMLHIRPRYLKALEEGRFSDLPGVAYTRGYLQSYASFLQLDKEEILRRFEQVEDALAKKSFYLPEVFSSEKAPSGTMVWGGAALALALYLFWLAALKPERVEISLVEPLPPGFAQHTHIPAAVFLHAACLTPRERLYPPCHVDGAEPFPLLPKLPTGQEIADAQKAADKAKEARKQWLKLPWQSDDERDE